MKPKSVAPQSAVMAVERKHVSYKHPTLATNKEGGVLRGWRCI